MRRLLLAGFVFTLITSSIQGQAWLDVKPSKKSSEKATFSDYQEAFYEFWEGREPERGMGYNQFARWEWFLKDRVDKDDLYKPSLLMEASKSRKSLGEKSKSGPANWTYIGPDSIPILYQTEYSTGMGRIDCIEFHPTDSNIFWVGSPTGGLWKTMDGGLTWTPLSDDIPSIGIGDIAVQANDPDIIYIGTGDRDAFDLDGVGLLKSWDGGNSWHSVNFDAVLEDELVVYQVLTHPSDTGVVLISTSEGMYRTQNGGTKWTQVETGRFKDLDPKKDDWNMILAGEYKGGNARIMRTMDGGINWEEVFTAEDGRRIQVATSTSEPSVAYAVVANLEGGLLGVYRTSNFGNTWTTSTPGSRINLLVTDPNGIGTGGQGWYDLTIEIAPDNSAEVYVGGINIWKSNNSGITWELKSYGYPYFANAPEDVPYVGVDQHKMKFHPLTGKLYIGNDKGVVRTDDRGESWIELSNDLHILQIYKIGASALNSNLVMTGQQDNGTFFPREGKWAKVYVADGGECLVDYTDTNTLYWTTQYGGLFRSDNGGLSYFYIKPDDAEDGAWITPFIIHPTNNNILFSGYEEVYMTVDKGREWIQRSNFNMTSGKVTALAISQSNPDYVYASAGSRMWRSTNSGETWSFISGSLPSPNITSIAVSQYDPKKVFITNTGYNDGSKVYRSMDGGTTWENYTANLPNVPTNCIVYENNSNQALYVGTDIGVFYRNNGMAEWISYNDGLPNVTVNEMEIHYGSGNLRAGTYGRGLWETDLYEDTSDPLYAEFTIEGSLQSCIESPFTFISKSTANADSLRWDFGVDATPTTSTSDTSQAAFSSIGNKTITLTVYRSGESSTETKIDFVQAVDDITISVVPEKTYIPLGDTLSLQAFGADQYVWSPPEGLADTIGENIVATPQVSTIYTVSAQQGVCADEATVEVNVYTNDSVCNPLLLTMGENGPFSNENATVELPDEPLPDTTGSNACNAPLKWCAEGGLQHSLWFSFVAPASGVVSIDTRGIDNQIALYDANSCQALLSGIYTLLAANDDFYPVSLFYAAAIEEANNLTPGKEYYLQVDGSAGGVVGEFFITIYDSPLSDGPDIYRSDISSINLYPNPGNGYLTLELSEATSEPTLIMVYGMNGQIVWNEVIEPHASNFKKELDLSAAPRGLYLIELVTGQKKVIRKIVVE